MLIKTQNGSAIVAGRVIKDAKVQKITTKDGKEIDKAQFLVSYGQEENEVLSCSAWRDQAIPASQIHKGDRVIAAGRYSERDYNGKTYSDIAVDFFVGGTVDARANKADTLDLSELSSDDIPF